MTQSVLRCDDVPRSALERVMARLGLTLSWCADRSPIPGSYWGEPEAGRIGSTLYLRADTPVHSALHEAGHFACMDVERRALETVDAGGSAVEECAVCYLQVCLAEQWLYISRARLLADMDRWGYSFRLGTAAAWFESDADDALAFLQHRGLLDGHARVLLM